MRLGILCGIGNNWRKTIEKVRIAESLGYEMVATGEAWGTSTLPWMTLLATHTERIQIGTSILNVYSRSPAAIAQEFAMLDVLSDGRMICGLGSSGHRVIEHFHGVEFKTPLRRLREYVEIINTLVAGDRLEYEGKIFQMSRGFTLDYQRPRTHIPIYIAAITPKSIVQTGEIADGIFPIHWPREHFSTLRTQLVAGASKTGRSADAITIAPFTNVYELNGKDDESVWMAARAPLFYYINRMGDFYWNMLADNGFEKEVLTSREAWSQRDRAGAMSAISKDMVREIQVIGAREELSAQLRERSDLGADVQLIPMPTGTTDQVAGQLEQFISES
ncbi:MAG: LLM class flavin-dependent oxidoreductase [Gammaproteobacteria bacterium]|nr:LLM class flavin-dependent oxidoreductase [Gammaproteobacteria bacterium]